MKRLRYVKRGEEREEGYKMKPNIWFLSLAQEPDLKPLGTSPTDTALLALFVFSYTLMGSVR